MKNKLCGTFLLAVAVLHCVLGDYELEVRLHEYNNPTSRCEGCGSDMLANGTELMRCCDHNGIVDVCEGGNRCDNYFASCFREIGLDGPCITDQLALTSPFFENSSSVDFTTIDSINSSVISDDNASSAVNGTNIEFNDSSSILLLQRTGAWEGVQFYTVVYDDDAGNLQYVDNFTIDLNTSFLVPGAGFTAQTVYNGVFGFGQLELSFKVSCAENFVGSDCATECIPLNNLTTCDENGTMVCLLGFTGANCMTNIDDCFNNDQCGSNGQCVDGISTFVCQCVPGFTGERCSAEIDECQGIDCSGNGQCIDELASFSCDCDADFTGERCETNIDDCASANCNDNSRCVDGVNSFTCECSAGFTGTLCENQIPPEVDSQGNTNAIIGGVVGAVIAAIVLVLILILVLMILTKTKKSQLKISGSAKDDNLTDNPTYGTSWNSLKPRVNDGSVATATTSTAPPKDTSVDDPEREFKNPIYGAPGFDTGDNEDRVYAQPRPV